MKRKAVLMSALAIGGAAICSQMAGCQATPVEAHDQTIALALLGPAEEQAVAADEQAARPTFRLGAGDALGQDLFVVYVASIMAEHGPVYATGEDPAPSSD